jgi:ribosomal-protein-alanine N-acetyltransferase
MTRVVAAVTGYAFVNLKAQRVFAEFFPWNRGSRRVLEKCGFRHEGTHRQAILKGGAWADMECWARLRGEGISTPAPEITAN